MARYANPTKKLCGAQRADGTTCQAWAIRGRNRCYRHGGKNPEPGPLHHKYEHGRCSQSYTTVAQLIQRAQEHGNLLDLEESLSHVKAARDRVAEMVDDLDTPEYRRRMVAMLREIQKAKKGGIDGLLVELIQKAIKLAEQGASESEALREWRQASMDLVAGQSKAWTVVLNGQSVLSAPAAVTMIMAICEIVQSETDEATGSRIVSRIGTEVMGAIREKPTSAILVAGHGRGPAAS